MKFGIAACMATTTPALHVRRWIEVPARDRLVAGIDAVFFETAGTQTFPDEASRLAFRERWLGRYLAHDPQHVWLALTPDDDVAGYLVGCVDDPATTPRFADIGYFATFAALTRSYPAHLHINLSARWRGGGAGSRLLAYFAADAASCGARGMHVVTALGMRNVGFYTRNGFAEVGRTEWTNGRTLLMLGRGL